MRLPIGSVTMIFLTFSIQGLSIKTSKRTIFEIKIKRKHDIIMISVEANSFAKDGSEPESGTLIEIGSKRKKDSLGRICT